MHGKSWNTRAKGIQMEAEHCAFEMVPGEERVILNGSRNPSFFKKKTQKTNGSNVQMFICLEEFN